MSFVAYTMSAGGAVGGVDPRVRVALTVAFSVVVVMSGEFPVLGLQLAVAIALVVAARLPLGPTCKRVLTVDAFVVATLMLLPFTVEGTAAFSLGPLVASHEGLLRAAAIALRANAVILVVLALLGTMEAGTLGHALGHLGVPVKLTQLFLFTVRYIGVLECEYARLRRAMKARAFRIRNGRHAYRGIGYLLGMLLVRSLERSERIVAAMKCRGFSGRFHTLAPHAMGRCDAVALAAGGAVLGVFLWLEWG
jgi:cobalt/nickel transport system permease protein